MVKKAKKAKSGKKKAKIILPPFDYEPPALHAKPSHFVRCRICSTALPHLNFEWPAVPTEITLDVIKNAIVKRHGGSLTSIMLYKDMVHPDTCIHADDSATLSSLGVAGILPGTADVELPSVTFHYDFRAACSDDAIVNVEYGAVQSAFGIPLKAYLRVQAHTAAQC